MITKIPKPKHLSLNISKTPNGRQLVIPDIHGCLNTFRALIKKIGLSKNDQLFLLGDYIDKGKDSVGVLDFLIELKGNGYQIFALQGNHEQMLLEKHHTKYNQIQLLLPHLRQNKGIIDSSRKILPKYYDFICNMPYFYELDNYFLVHAGFNLISGNPFDDFESMLWMREFDMTKSEQERYFNNKKIIFGHTPTPLPIIQEDIITQKSTICLDNGCVFSSKSFLGNLLCLNLDTLTLIVQTNLEDF